ncbi:MULTISPECIES: hypothetical protein [Pseudonocardia]|uniref:Uncharacterized protein n=1 Tax=Pseudonocardia oroxyli TaxID=366584 RepID=A0A1G7LBT5_PSEOR|nr:MULTISPECIES: hypothetical protein [Pseudonocardia]MCF7552066.1 hypothetical protein [Pseudonocardia sp. WMMC193]SDF46449.1 hypothetical protein SAMN05216377_10530 [Pseudonocardia oroxyli]
MSRPDRPQSAPSSWSTPPRPRSTTPLADYLDRPVPGAGPDYLVVPRSLAEAMPLRWQQVFAGLLADLHDAYGHLDWPDYRVVPSRWELLADLDEEQLAAAGYVADLTADGTLEYRDAAGRPAPDSQRALAPVEETLPHRGDEVPPPRPAPPL